MNKRIYLDNASTTFPKPSSVPEAMFRYMTESGANVGRGGYASAYETEEAVYETRELLCELFHGGDCKNAVFTKNVTESLNLLIKGFLRPGDHVLVSSMEHNAVMRPLTQMTAHGVSFSRIPCTSEGELVTDGLENLLRPETKAVIMTHASNVCGTVMPIREVGRFCRDHNLRFFVDCAQTAGVLPIDMEECLIDGLAFTGHKGLLGPQGIGGLILREELAAQIEPLLSGGTGSISHTEEVPTFMPDRFEPGTMNLPGIIGLRAGLLWLKERGLASIASHELALTERFLAGLLPLEKAGRLHIAGKRGIIGRTGVVSLQINGCDQAKAAWSLTERYGIMTRVGLHCAPFAHRTLGTYPEGTIRFSFGWANREEEVDTALAAIEELCHGL